MEANEYSEKMKEYNTPSLSNGLAAVGSAAALIYGVTGEVRWWKVVLLMMGGAAMGRGLGYIMENKNKNNTQSMGTPEAE